MAYIIWKEKGYVQYKKSTTKQNLINQHMALLANITQKHAESS